MSALSISVGLRWHLMFTKGENILKAGYQQTVIKIMGIMDRNGFSYAYCSKRGIYRCVQPLFLAIFLTIMKSL